MPRFYSVQTNDEIVYGRNWRENKEKVNILLDKMLISKITITQNIVVKLKNK